MKMEELFCPICHLATMQEHPMASMGSVYNQLLKCSNCGFSKCKTAHQEDVEKIAIARAKEKK